MLKDYTDKEEVRLMETKKTKEGYITKAQVRQLIARIFAKLAVDLEDPSLIVAGMMGMEIMEKELKELK